MGYAKIYFEDTVQASDAMFDVINVITGNYTSASELSYGSTTLSQVINTSEEDWSLLYGTLANTTTQYVLTSPCVIAGKIHYVRFQSCNSSAFATSSTFAGGGGIGLATCTSAISANIVSNETFYSTNTTNLNSVRTVTGVENYIRVSWSARHVSLHGHFFANTIGMLGSYEYAENGPSLYVNTAPTAQWNWYFGCNTTAYNSETTPGANATLNYATFQATNIYVPANSTIQGVRSIGDNLTYGSDNMALYPNLRSTIGNDGQSAAPLIAIYRASPFFGIPEINISAFGKIYKTVSNTGTIVDDNINFDSNTYVYLPFSTTSTNTNSVGAVAVYKG